jgi:hypothetical protein
VPGTALCSYLNIGAIPDPNYGDNQLLISDSFFYADFWYRNEFTAPTLTEGQRVWLNFDGINWKADVFLNGEKLGRIKVDSYAAASTSPGACSLAAETRWLSASRRMTPPEA